MIILNNNLVMKKFDFNNLDIKQFNLRKKNLKVLIKTMIKLEAI